MSVYPEPGSGLDCTVASPADCGVPLDTPLELRFDRYLLPRTAIRQAIRLYSGSPNRTVLLEPSYDLVERVVTYVPGHPGGLAPGLLYEVRITLPAEDRDGYGFRAFDGAPLEEDGSVDLSFSFRTREAPAADPAAVAPPPCTDALAVLRGAGCPTCHAQGKHPPMGLALDSGPSLDETAIARVAHETDTGPTAGAAVVDGPRFGAGLAVIAPSNPAESYLLYKLLANPGNFGTGAAACTTAHAVAMPRGACPEPSSAERARLAEWMVPLDPMPRGGTLPGGVEDLRLLQVFIAYGADTSGCP